jgi:CDP-diacylglycerol--glycerol-3-phosphate 3-phosphatidyltransferase
MKKKEKLLNVPNTLTLLRFISLPVLIVLAYNNMKFELGIVFVLSWFTDALDGFFARTLKQTTKFGAWFDSVVDDLLGLMLPVLLYFVAPEVFTGLVGWAILLLVVLFIGIVLNAKVKKRSMNFHLYSAKATAIFMFVFGGLTFLYAFLPWLFWLGFVAMIYSYLEMFLLINSKGKYDEDTKSFFF